MTDTWTWATVTQASPLRIKVDGDAAELNATTDDLVGSLAVDDRVRVHLHADGIIVVGRMEGLGPIAQFGAYNIAPTVDPFLSVGNSGSQSTLHITSSAGFSGPYLIGVGNDSGWQAGLLVSNKATGVGLFVSQAATLGAATAYGIHGSQNSTLAPLMRITQQVTGAADGLQLVVGANAPSSTQRHLSVSDFDGEAGYMWAAGGKLDWRRDVRVQPDATSEARLVLASPVGTSESFLSRLYVGPKEMTFLTATGSSGIKYPRKIYTSGDSLIFATASNLSISDATAATEAASTISGIAWHPQIEMKDYKLGFFGAAPVIKSTVTGSRGGNAALASALTALANLGLINDSST